MSKLTSDYVGRKILENENYIRITYYELRVKNNLSENEANEFLLLNRAYLESMGYDVYFTGDKFIYQNANRVVEANELMIAVKKKNEVKNGSI